jgi:hypothetical protein
MHGWWAWGRGKGARWVVCLTWEEGAVVEEEERPPLVWWTRPRVVKDATRARRDLFCVNFMV